MTEFKSFLQNFDGKVLTILSHIGYLGRSNELNHQHAHRGIEVIEVCIHQAHLNGFPYVRHGLVHCFAIGVTALEKRTANYVVPILIEFNYYGQT